MGLGSFPMTASVQHRGVETAYVHIICYILVLLGKAPGCVRTPEVAETGEEERARCRVQHLQAPAATAQGKPASRIPATASGLWAN